MTKLANSTPTPRLCSVYIHTEHGTGCPKASITFRALLCLVSKEVQHG